MPSILYTVDDIVSEVRAQIDEANVDSVSTATDILPTMNRAQLYAFDILARKYPEPILQHTTLTLVSGVAEYTIPEDIFEDRVLRIEIEIPGASGRSTYREVQRISYRELYLYESSSTDSVPLFYCLIGRKLRFVGTPSGTYNARMWSLRNPERLTLSQGRVTLINSGSNYVIVDSTGDSITTETDQLGSYVNVIDGQTGEIKGSLQVQIATNNKITFRTTPTRSIVLNRDILGDLSDVSINQDDYLAPIEGTCVPYYGQPVTNFLVQYTVAELVRKLGGESDKEEAVLQKFEKQVERAWSGRETALRVKRKSQSWSTPYRRWEWK